jgi:hypothetical protein
MRPVVFVRIQERRCSLRRLEDEARSRKKRMKQSGRSLVIEEKDGNCIYANGSQSDHNLVKV